VSNGQLGSELRFLKRALEALYIHKMGGKYSDDIQLELVMETGNETFDETFDETYE